MAGELLIKDLRTQIERRQVTRWNSCDIVGRCRIIAIVGAGVSMGATDGNQLASWIGLLEDGVQRCCDLFNGVTDGWRERVLAEIAPAT